MTRILYVALLYAFLRISSGCSSTESWRNIQPAWDAKQNYAAVRLEGKSELADRLGVYGYLDADAAKEDPTNLKNLYGELRVSYSLGRIGAAAECDAGSNYRDTVRLGVAATPTIHSDNFTLLKFFPYEASGEKGAQLSIFTSQTLGSSLNVSVLIDYNFPNSNGKASNGTLYIEPEIDLKLTESSKLFIQGRGFGSIDDKIDLAPIIGVKFSF